MSHPKNFTMEVEADDLMVPRLNNLQEQYIALEKEKEKVDRRVTRAEEALEKTQADRENPVFHWKWYLRSCDKAITSAEKELKEARAAQEAFQEEYDLRSERLQITLNHVAAPITAELIRHLSE